MTPGPRVVLAAVLEATGGTIGGVTSYLALRGQLLCTFYLAIMHQLLDTGDELGSDD